MLSSPESDDQFSSHDDDNNARARTPTGAGPTTATHTHDELSPPGSLGQHQSSTATVAGTAAGTAAGQEKGSGTEKPQPGASWMNKRAEEEYQRAMEYVVDKDFSLRMFSRLMLLCG